MSAVASVVFDYVPGPREYRLPVADALPERPGCGAMLVAPARYGLAVGRLVALHDESAIPPLEEAWPASARDLTIHQTCRREADEALAECRAMVGRHDLPMRLVGAFKALDGAQLTFFFTAPGRVDFRSLLREAVRYFRLPLRLEQISERDAARIIGGIGRCGRELCCCSWLADDLPVALRHARAQGLPALPAQLSGQCAKLRCCLRYELDADELAGERRRSRADGPVKTASHHWLGESDDDPSWR